MVGEIEWLGDLKGNAIGHCTLSTASEVLARREQVITQ